MFREIRDHIAVTNAVTRQFDVPAEKLLHAMAKHLIPFDATLKAIKTGALRKRLNDGTGLCLLLFVKVMSKMAHLAGLLVLAIPRRRATDELEGQYREQKNHEALGTKISSNGCL